MIFTRGSDTETTLNAAALSELERQRAFSDPQGIPVKEFKVDIRKPQAASTTSSAGSAQGQIILALEQQAPPPAPPARQAGKAKSFLQQLTQRFGPDLVRDYLMTKNLTSVRRLIKLEESQRCRCLCRQQMNAYEMHLEMEQWTRSALAEIVRQIDKGTKNVSQT